jgi:hypothetical protein
LAISGKGVALARYSGNDAIHLATPRFAIEGFKIRPNRTLIQDALLHAPDQDFDAIYFPLDMADRSSIGYSESDGKAESVNSAAQGKHVEGT